jgi:hypothetical protein
VTHLHAPEVPTQQAVTILTLLQTLLVFVALATWVIAAIFVKLQMNALCLRKKAKMAQMVHFIA